MKTIFLALAFSALATGAFASCKTDSADRKLAGAALTSHMKKCSNDATKACEADSMARKLSGAAKSSHMKKCVHDAVGS